MPRICLVFKDKEAISIILVPASYLRWPRFCAHSTPFFSTPLPPPLPPRHTPPNSLHPFLFLLLLLFLHFRALPPPPPHPLLHPRHLFFSFAIATAALIISPPLSSVSRPFRPLPICSSSTINSPRKPSNSNLYRESAIALSRGARDTSTPFLDFVSIRRPNHRPALCPLLLGGVCPFPCLPSPSGINEAQAHNCWIPTCHAIDRSCCQ
ncbi:hypothetical protein XA68_10492 [Ophiocordyceps unilateralis]|uniref:Uncharacterized protein n=1 Tax=Ophiocordyceps unilateralis TaxID=268505 RepID=A0A2A9P1W6_OPHUN|nr:hypothetical protein XA68_10492 [Ophiocordyceps unilateralis]